MDRTSPTVLGMMEHYDLDQALLLWLETKLDDSDDDTYHDSALNYLVGLLLRESDARDAAPLARVM